MRISRKAVAIFLIAGACLFTLLVVSLNTIIERNHDRIRDEIQKALGRDLKFDQLQLNIWGGLGLAATNLRIAEDPKFAATPFIQTKELRMKVGWLSLLLGRVVVKEFTLQDPEIQIIKSETGKINISTLFSTAREAPPTDGDRKASTDRETRRRATLALSGSGLRISRGRLHYIDRAAKEPFEMQVRNLEMSVTGSPVTGRADLRLAASLSEDRTRNIAVEGRIGPYGAERDWAKYPLDLEVNVDSLLLSNLTRALPLARETIPSFLGINGPVSLKAKLSGSFERPRIRDLHIAGPFFGATERNTTVEGELDFSRDGTWKEGELKGKIVVNPVRLDRLRLVPFLQPVLPASLSVDGPLSVSSELSGRVEDLRLRALVKADEGEIHYGDWLRKAKGLPAALELNLRSQKDRLLVEPSRLTLHNLKLDFSGALEESAERLVSLRFLLAQGSLSGWDGLIIPLAPYQTRGTLDFDLSLEKALGAPQAKLSLRGNLTLMGAQAKLKDGGRGIDQLNLRATFVGQQIRLERSSLRLGSSTLALEATMADLTRPAIQYTLWSPKLSLADLTAQPAYQSAWLKELKSTGVAQNEKDGAMLSGRFSSTEGSLQDILYTNLQGEVSWTPGGASIKGLSLQALGGTIRADGSWEEKSRESQRLALSARIEGMDLKSFVSQKFPRFKDHVAGKLNLNAKLRAEGKNDSLWQEMRGEGETEIRDGIVKDVNLPGRVLGKVTGLPGIPQLLAAPLPARYRSVLDGRDTPFQKLAASFRVAERRIYARELVLATPEYTVQGEGWLGFDRSMRWAAELVMSPQFAQAIVKQHRNARYLLDRHGKLAVPFRVEGTLPQMQPKPDTQWLAEQIQRGLVHKGPARPPAGDTVQRRKERQDWIQKGLEKLFGK